MRMYLLLICSVLAACSGDDSSSATDAPGAALACATTGKNAFDTYGQASFFTLTKNILTHAGAELMTNGAANLGDSIPNLGTGTLPSNHDDAKTFEGKVAAYFTWAYGGPTEIQYSDGITYVGPQDMTAAHLGMAITGAQYDYFITDVVVPALIDTGVAHAAAGDDIATCYAPLLDDARFKAAMVNQ